MLPRFSLERPTSLDELLPLLNEDAMCYRGGTELLMAMKLGLLRPGVLLDVKRVPELQGIDIRGEMLVIGAATTHSAVMSSLLVRRELSILASVAARVGNARVRAQGSVGGNLCFAEPKSDVMTLLAVLGAEVSLVSVRRSRRLPVGEFLLGAYATVRDADEVMVDVRVPITAGRAVYRKHQYLERPTVGVAAARVGDGWRVAVGAVADVPRVWVAPDLADFDPRSMAGELEPTADLAGQVDYKRHLAEVYLRRVLAEAREDGESDA
jgi:carbon-monoxide dehydrogenase medium subunit